MNLKLYFKVTKFYFLSYLVYPIESVVYILRYIARIIFLIIFWSLVFTESNITLEYSLFGYFLLSTAISDLVMSDSGNLGRAVRKSISSGNINQVLVRPVNIISFFYFQTVGAIGIKLIMGIASMVLGLIIIQPQTLLSLVLYIIFFLQALAIAFAYNVFEGALALNYTEINGIKNAMHHINRLLSGQIIPLTFFPELVRNILLLTPIPFMVFVPINALTINAVDNAVIVQVLTGIFWSIFLNFIVYKYWINSLRKYDAAGN